MSKKWAVEINIYLFNIYIYIYVLYINSRNLYAPLTNFYSELFMFVHLTLLCDFLKIYQWNFIHYLTESFVSNNAAILYLVECLIGYFV